MRILPRPVLIGLCCLAAASCRAEPPLTAQRDSWIEAGRLQVVPAAYSGGLRNPLMGITNSCEWNTLEMHYIEWNAIEASAADGAEKIVAYCDERWRELPAKGIKVIPRVYLLWDDMADPAQKHWPADLAEGDWTSETFIVRCEKLIAKLGQAWDADPRVAFIELGLIGKWGEHHSPDPSPELQARLAAAATAAFPHKQVSVRHFWTQFTAGDFGEYWDSFAHYDQVRWHGQAIADFNAATGRWKTRYIGGEVAYNWGRNAVQPGESPTDSVKDPVHLNFILNCVRWTHTTQTRWIHLYDPADAAARAGAEKLQATLGYRFELARVELPTARAADGSIGLAVTVRNTGSAPFYYPWPVYAYLLDAKSRRPVWSQALAGVDVRTWLPGDFWTGPDWLGPNGLDASVAWSAAVGAWAVPAADYRFAAALAPPSFPAADRILALAIVDPAGGAPAVRFASADYLAGGYAALALLRADGTVAALPGDFRVDDPRADGADGRLPYAAP
jgi:hypothetical protein